MTPKQRSRRHQRYLVLAVVLGGVVLLGITIAQRIDLSRSTTLTAPEGRELIVSEITVGTLVNASDANKKDPRIRQASTYTTTSPLALRITTDPSVTKAFTVSARLLTPAGSIIELAPSQATFQPGTSTFCCWQVATPGRYTLQIFRPEKVITSLPLIIEAASTQVKPLL